ncbi:hypothetical protein BOTCAL_0090g00140 [Botryotinia calthae]|uniref:Uncharacterized protein n=1 Tax=Botryotinia calthae TaxID=38488 RepID=A0A4Y8D705_9HELO|nr:hypothetical protein BOTCAL_0090g00140 [Botryotinia calthae]
MNPGWFYRRSLSNDEAKQFAASYMKRIQQHRKYLIEILAKHGDIIINRWKKKGQDKRQALLLEAIPNLCEKRWIIPCHGFTSEGKDIPPINSDGQMEMRSRETRHHFLLNWLNLEVLKTNPVVLFALLCNRTGITEAIKSSWRWGWVKNGCERFKSIHDRFRDNIEDLPSKYDKALGALELLMVNDVNRRGDLLGRTTPQRPGFFHIYTTTRKPQEQGPAIHEVNHKNGLLSDPKYAFENELLDYCLVQLQVNLDIQQNLNTCQKEIPIDHALLFSILENHLAKSNIKEKSRLDEVLSNLLSDLAASHELLAAIRLHRPLNRPRALDEVLKSENRKTWKAFNVKSNFTIEACSKLRDTLIKNFHEIKAPTGRKDCAMVWKQNGFTEAEMAEGLECISATTTQEYLSATQAEE